MQSIGSSRGRVLLGALLLIAALVVGARFVLGGRGAADEPAAPVELRASAAAGPELVVHVVGAVRQPGLYRLQEGARVADAVARAGGATPKADLALVNLAAPLGDGQQVAVPRRAPPGPAAVAPSAASAPAGPVQLSIATAEQLDALPGVGPVTAQKIIDYRQAHGPFRSVDDLDAIPGIGPARVEQLRGLVVP